LLNSSCFAGKFYDTYPEYRQLKDTAYALNKHRWGGNARDFKASNHETRWALRRTRMEHLLGESCEARGFSNDVIKKRIKDWRWEYKNYKKKQKARRHANYGPQIG
jgi:hypothetical protein